MAIVEKRVFVTSDQKSFTDRSKAEVHEGRLQLADLFVNAGPDPMAIIKTIEAHQTQITAHFKAIGQLKSESARLVAQAAEPIAPAQPAAAPSQPVAPRPVAPIEPVSVTPIRPEAIAVPPRSAPSSLGANTTLAGDEQDDEATATVPALDDDESASSRRLRPVRRRRR